MRQLLFLIAASGLAREVMATVEAAGTHKVVGVLDDDVALHGTAFGRTKVLGGVDLALDYPDAQVLACVGSGSGRENVVRRLGAFGIADERFATVIHPCAVVPKHCDVGTGTIVLANVVLTADVSLGRHVVAMPSVVLTHDDVVEDFATLCAGVVLGGGVRVGRAAYLGMNSSVRQRVRVGRCSVLGMGSALLQDLPDGQTWVGVPARGLVDETGAMRSSGHDPDVVAEPTPTVRMMERTEAL